MTDLQRIKEDRTVLSLAVAAIDAGEALEEAVRPMVEALLPANVTLKRLRYTGSVYVTASCEGLDSIEQLHDIARTCGERLHFDRGYVLTDVWVEVKVSSYVRVRFEVTFLHSEISEFYDQYRS